MLNKRVFKKWTNINDCWYLNEIENITFTGVNKKYAKQLGKALKVNTFFYWWFKSKMKIFTNNIIRYKLFNTLLRYQEYHPEFIEALPEKFTFKDLYDLEIKMFKGQSRHYKCWISHQYSRYYKDDLNEEKLNHFLDDSYAISSFNYKCRK